MPKTSQSKKHSQTPSAKKTKRNPSTPLRHAQGRSGSNDQVSAKGHLTMADLLESTGYKIPALKRGQEVTGKVISKDRSEIIIDIGAKSEGIVFGREFDAVRDLAPKLTATYTL